MQKIFFKIKKSELGAQLDQKFRCTRKQNAIESSIIDKKFDDKIDVEENIEVEENLSD